MNLKKQRSKRPSPSRLSRTEDLVVKHAAECYEEILNDIRFNQGMRWFLIIERKMRRLVTQVMKSAE